jgi:hypothetical protein
MSMMGICPWKGMPMLQESYFGIVEEVTESPELTLCSRGDLVKIDTSCNVVLRQKGCR